MSTVYIWVPIMIYRYDFMTLPYRGVSITLHVVITKAKIIQKEIKKKILSLTNKTVYNVVCHFNLLSAF